MMSDMCRLRNRRIKCEKSDREIQGKDRIDYQNLIDEVNKSGGFGFIAHPYGAKQPPFMIKKGSYLK